MAYDLLYRKKIPVNFSAHPTSEPSLNTQTSLTLVTLGVAFLEAILKETGRKMERHHYQREFQPGHHPTIEMPAISMAQMVRNFPEE